MAAEGLQGQPEPHDTSFQKTKIETSKILPLLKVHFFFFCNSDGKSRTMEVLDQFPNNALREKSMTFEL